MACQYHEIPNVTPVVNMAIALPKERLQLRHIRSPSRAPLENYDASIQVYTVVSCTFEQLFEENIESWNIRAWGSLAIRLTSLLQVQVCLLCPIGSEW